MNNNYQLNYDLLNKEYLSTSDVLIKPSTGLVASRKDISIENTFIFSSPMDTVASEKLFNKMLMSNQAALSCRFFSVKERLQELNKFHKAKNYWFTVGASVIDYDMLSAWAIKNPNKQINVSVDVAHGDTLPLHHIYRKYSSAKWCKNLMSGTVASYPSAKNCHEAGCNYIRVGIGPGSACSTRIVTGCGVPNLSAVFQIWDGFSSLTDDPPYIIADGGIRGSADIAKYLAAGANGVMVGSLLSKTEESGGWKINYFKYLFSLLTFSLIKNYKYKNYRGQASKEFQLSRRGFVSGVPEGVQAPAHSPKYSYDSFYSRILSSLKSTISYAGVRELNELNPDSVQLIKITQNGIKESTPHILS